MVSTSGSEASSATWLGLGLRLGSGSIVCRSILGGSALAVLGVARSGLGLLGGALRGQAGTALGKGLLAHRGLLS